MLSKERGDVDKLNKKLLTKVFVDGSDVAQVLTKDTTRRAGKDRKLWCKGPCCINNVHIHGIVHTQSFRQSVPQVPHNYSWKQGS